MNLPPYIFGEDFLLQSPFAKKLYHDHACKMPIIDYHNHLSPEEIAENINFQNLTHIWLGGDHYKWRAMRSLGISEEYITGKRADEEKFTAWASCVPKLIRNPLFHWTHLELKAFFGIEEYLNVENAGKIYAQCNEMLRSAELSTRSIIKKFNVKFVGTTDDPADDLRYHQHLAKSESDFTTRPTFRPDPVLHLLDVAAFRHYQTRLASVAGFEIDSYGKLIRSLKARIEYFHEQGCRISDHGLTEMPPVPDWDPAMEREFDDFLGGKTDTLSSPQLISGQLLLVLCKMYHERNWVQQFHLGALRNNRTRLMHQIGRDAGVDSIGDFRHAGRLSKFLDQLDKQNVLARTILYNNNPIDNAVFATMAGNFNDGQVTGKIQFGSGWWFLDQLDGMEQQINTLSNMGVLSTFIGMTTDSRSFMSFPRHEYFRRMLCNLLAEDVNSGQLPPDESWLSSMVKDICYHNSSTYFQLK